MIDVQKGFVFGDWHYSDGGTYGPLNGAYVTLLMIHRGAARVFFDGAERTLVTGECAVIVNRASLHIHYQKHIRTHVSWCEARPADISRRATAEAPLARKLEISERLLKLQTMGIDLGLESASTRNGFRNALGLAVFGAYAFESKLVEEQQRIPNGILKVRTYIDENFASECTVTQLANIGALTPTYLVASFAHHFGITPIRHLWMVRAAHARRLLLHTNLTAYDISFRCGYKSPYHFSRHIKRVYGLSPKALRESKAYRPPSNALEDVQEVVF
ncbi:AraC family transcriptional regulator [Pseudomonas cichorii]|nr:helix-turn-helix-domain containing protein AraC type [Pseudomonas sp. St290]GFM84548.1 AraC family transcriptional regulator [Pseudomonas cichorii]